MIDVNTIDCSPFDRPEILLVLFYPRGESGWSPSGPAFEELSIPTEKAVTIGGRFYTASPQAPTILFFHGNGEIVEDYADIGVAFTRSGINFMPVDYRGYGRSTGKPGVTGMMRDCHYIFDFAKDFLREKEFPGPLIVMGRSLGSASALELAAHYGSEIRGLVIESGFAFALPLLRLLGVSTADLKISEEDGFNNVAKIKNYRGPALIIHAEKDHIIPFSDGQALFEACPSPRKEFLEIKRANHNNILQYGINEYFRKIGEIAAKASES
jgi:hypothetical protein